MPDMARVSEVYKRQVVRFVDQQIFPTVEALNQRIAQTQGAPKWVNKLAVLYSRYGLLDRALKEYDKILGTTEYLPALLNVGTIYFSRGDASQAKSFYERAMVVAPEHPAVLLSLARAHHELENYGTAREFHTKLAQVDANLASEYEYLDMRGEEASRAADAAGLRGKMIWIDDEG